MRIVYIHQYFNTPAMSGGTRSFEMARRLVASGHEVHMVTSNREQSSFTDSAWQETVESGIHVHWLPCQYNNKLSIFQRLKAFSHFARKACKKATSLNGDVVFASSTPLTVGIPGVYASRKCKVPLVFEVRDLWPAVPIAMGFLENRLLRMAAIQLERWIYRHSSEIVALAPGMRDGIVSQGIDPDKVHVIPNSCDFDLFCVPDELGQQFRSRYDWLGNRPMVTYTGTLGRVNNVQYMAQIASHSLKINPDICFVVVGNGAEQEAIATEAKRLGVLDVNFFMLGNRAKKEMPAIMSASTICTSFVSGIPILKDNCANKVFDSLAAKRPIAVNHGGWLGELIEERKCGIQLPNANAQEAASLFNQRISDDVWMKNARAEAVRLGEEQFNRDKLAIQLEAVLKRAVGDCGEEQSAENLKAAA